MDWYIAATRAVSVGAVLPAVVAGGAAGAVAATVAGADDAAAAGADVVLLGTPVAPVDDADAGRATAAAGVVGVVAAAVVLEPVTSTRPTDTRLEERGAGSPAHAPRSTSAPASTGAKRRDRTRR
jgi:hypothetical protein